MSAELLGKWYHEDLGGGAMHSYKFRGNLMSVQTKFQRCEIVDTQAYGQVLMLDDVLNSAQADEYIYHESLVHPAMLSHPAPRTVFIGGGGEGATLREVLRHTSVEKCVMVDIDGELVDVFKASPEVAFYSDGAFEDPRTELICDDAKGRLESYPDGSFDVIVLDLADPVECGPAFPLWTKEYYDTCFAKLSVGGVLVTQAGPLSVNQVRDICTPCAHTLAATFEKVHTYGSHIPSFANAWAFNMAVKPGAAAVGAGDVDRLVAERLDPKMALRFYDAESHLHMFSLPKPVREMLAAETRVATEAEPLVFVAGTGIGGA